MRNGMELKKIGLFIGQDYSHEMVGILEQASANEILCKLPSGSLFVCALS